MHFDNIALQYYFLKVISIQRFSRKTNSLVFSFGFATILIPECGESTEGEAGGAQLFSVRAQPGSNAECSHYSREGKWREETFMGNIKYVSSLERPS